MHRIRRYCLAALCVVIVHMAVLPHSASAQGRQDGWEVAVYPVLAWVPLSIGIDVDLPPSGSDAGGAGGIVDSRFDGAFLGGAAASNGTWRIEADGIWAGFGGDRAERPTLIVDLNVIYGHASLGRKIAPDLFLTAGVRRLALKYDITLGDLPHVSRTPGVWNPLVGVGWHRPGQTVE